MYRRTRAHDDARPHESANERFKRRFGPTFWSSVIGAVVAHFALFAFFPTLSVADIAGTDPRMMHIELPPEARLPDEPAPIRRPAAPVIAEVDVNLTIDPNVPLPGEPVPLPVPPVSRQGEVRDPGAFTPYTLAPRLLNKAE
ncbi:MAG: hypothetical protein ACREME_11225, partial [Gemmatimonadales bacterium]